jgi:anaerobic magnesium-protoporphyrin IX monomethyl ester cyclase
MPGRAEDVVFIINPSLWHKPMYPTGVLCLSNYLESKGIPNRLLDSRLSRGKEGLATRMGRVLEAVRFLQPKVVCFSATHREFDEVVRMNEGIKDLNSGIRTIVGGSQPTYRYSDFIDNGFDFVCRGEGEKTLAEFVTEGVKKAPAWDGIDGLIFRDREKVIVNKGRKLLEEAELDSRVFPAYEKIDPRYFDYSVEIIRGLPVRGGLLLTTRGCPYDCSFCGCNAIFGRGLRFRPVESIEAELIELKSRRRVEAIWIVDDTFTVNKNHVAKIAELLRKYDMIWGCQSRVDTIDRPTIEIMKRCGCVQMDFGVESGSQRILDDVIGKKTKIEQVRKAFALAREYGIRTLANFMIGLPTETKEDLQATKKLAESIKADVYVFSIATPLPGTRLYELVGEEIGPHQYSALDWNGSSLTAQLNKSELRNIIVEKSRLKRKYLFRSVMKSVFVKKDLVLRLLRRDPIGRLRAILKFVPTHLLNRG